MDLLLVIIFFVEIKNYFEQLFKKYFFFRKIVLYIRFIRFVITKIIFFFIFFEVSLIPIFILILGWGYQPERLYARIIMVFYTLTFSLPILIVILLWINLGLIYFNQIRALLISEHNTLLKNFLLIFLLSAMLVKLPIFFLHIWLPQAHVEAPVEGRMILAGILLKIGGYGILRLKALFIHEILFSKISFIVRIVGGGIRAFLCIQQVDFKVIIAFSSIRHMAIVIARSLTLRTWGLWGSLIILFSHGLVSSRIFFGVNYFYKTSGSRRVFLNKGFLLYSPIFTQIWFLCCLINMRGPPRPSLVGEILCCVRLISFMKILTLPIIVLLILGVLYNLNLYNSLAHGLGRRKKIFITEITPIDILIFLFHFSFCFLLIIGLKFLN